MKRSMPSSSAIPATGTVWTVASVAASVTKVDPATPATPFDMISITAKIVSICCALRWIFVACAMKSTPIAM